MIFSTLLKKTLTTKIQQHYEDTGYYNRQICPRNTRVKLWDEEEILSWTKCVSSDKSVRTTYFDNPRFARRGDQYVRIWMRHDRVGVWIVGPGMWWLGIWIARDRRRRRRLCSCRGCKINEFGGYEWIDDWLNDKAWEQQQWELPTRIAILSNARYVVVYVVLNSTLCAAVTQLVGTTPMITRCCNSML